MKKLLPFFLLTLSFVGLVTFQLLLDIFDSKAVSPSEDQEYTRIINETFSQGSFLNLKGESIQLKKVNSPLIILEFSATWCAPCKREIEKLNFLFSKYSEYQIQIFSLYAEDELTPQKLFSYGKQNKIKFPLIYDEGGRLTSSFRITKVPSFLIFYEGELVGQNLGEGLDLDQLTEKFLPQL